MLVETLWSDPFWSKETVNISGSLKSLISKFFLINKSCVLRSRKGYQKEKPHLYLYQSRNVEKAK